MDQEDRLLEGLQAANSSGRTNIFDKRTTAIIVESYGYLEEAEQLQNMRYSQYHFFLGDFKLIKSPTVLNIYWVKPRTAGACSLREQATVGDFIFWIFLENDFQAYLDRKITVNS